MDSVGHSWQAAFTTVIQLQSKRPAERLVHLHCSDLHRESVWIKEDPAISAPYGPCQNRLITAIVSALGVFLFVPLVQANAVLQLSALDGNNGFRLDGVAAGDFSGFDVSGIGDINGDGVGDVIIAASGAGPDAAGSSYVLFGRSSIGFAPVLDLSSLDGSTGFRLDGAASAVSAAGDINNDGVDDLIIGTDSGSSYVLFGRSSSGFAPAIDLASLDGSTGFRLDGGGSAVSAAGDINGDGVDDLIIGEFRAHPGVVGAGSSFVLFGRGNGDFPSVISLSLLDGINGFRLDGTSLGDQSGMAVAGAGDINGDGISDLIVGAPYADPNGSNSGSSYVVFGRTGGFDARMDLASLDGQSGFRLDGVAEGELSGASVSAAGDFNGDGVDDLIIGARFSSQTNSLSGCAYVVLGSRSGFGSVLNLSSLDGSNGFRLSGPPGTLAGASVAVAGDINGDRVDDLIIGAPFAESNGMGSGSSFVVYGRRAGMFAASVNLSSLDGSTGFRIDGAASGDVSGGAVSGAGDINGDGVDDIVIGATGTDANGKASGSSYVVFGASSSIFWDGFEVRDQD